MPAIHDVAQMIRFTNQVDLGIKRAFANVAAGSTAASVVAATTNKKIRVLSYHCQAGATATTLVFESNGVAISSTKDNVARGGAVGNFNPAGWFETVKGEALTVTTGAGSTIGIDVVYAEVR